MAVASPRRRICPRPAEPVTRQHKKQKTWPGIRTCARSWPRPMGACRPFLRRAADRARRFGTASRCCNGTPAAIWRAGTRARWCRAAPSIYGLILTAGVPLGFLAGAGAAGRAYGLDRGADDARARARQASAALLGNDDRGALPRSPPCPGSPPSCSPISSAGSACWRFICC